MQPRDLNAELAPVARLRQRDMANMKLDIEIRIVDPVWAVEIQWHLLQFLAKRFGTVRPVIHKLQDIL